MTVSVSSSNSPSPEIIPETSKAVSPRIVHTSSRFRASMDREPNRVKLPKPISEKTRRKKKETDPDKKVKEEKWKKDFVSIRPRMVFPVKKMTSVISSVFSRKKTLAGENRDDSGEITEADDILAINPKHNPIHQKESFWESARIRLKILIIGQRLKTRRKIRRKRSLSEGIGEEELCKKRILMGERCKPINRSGVLQYDGDGILLPEP